ncbi:MAG TPA: L-aspartate oxidase [Chloroflexota bacterium]|nr:L-aspartate oxidase [Chloroflexota bacterium]
MSSTLSAGAEPPHPLSLGVEPPDPLSQDEYDYVVVGSGIAGLFTAVLAAQQGRVAVVTKGTLSQTNTRWAQGGIAAAIAADDTAALHAADTLAAGAGLCDPEAVRVLCAEGPARIRDLIHAGVDFDTVDGVISLAMEGAHSRRRVLHARGDATGAEIEHALTRRAVHSGARLLEHHLLLDLAVAGGRCTGCTVLDLNTKQVRRLSARHVVLATGGGGYLFAHTTNPPVATADGVAVALRAGAEVADLEFFQFHPTALMLSGAPRFLISEATRGDGAHLRNTRGERFMPRYDPRAELAPRDIVSRAILTELQATGEPHVWLDLTHLDPARVEGHFPTITRVCRRYGIEITRQPIPVAPAAHYMIGGIRTDVWGRTSLPGLFAAGECASSGVHGANRLASNSLLEAVVFARRIVDASQGILAPSPPPGPEETEEAEDAPPVEVSALPALPTEEKAAPTPTSARVRALLWERVSITRDGAGLEEAEATLRRWLAGYRPRATRPSVELANVLLVGWQMTRAALRRRESRGAHYRDDFPRTLPAWRRRTAVCLETPQPLTLAT